MKELALVKIAVDVVFMAVMIYACVMAPACAVVVAVLIGLIRILTHLAEFSDAEIGEAQRSREELGEDVYQQTFGRYDD